MALKLEYIFAHSHMSAESKSASLLDHCRRYCADKLREDGDKNADKRVSAPLDAPTASWVLEPLRLAAASSNPRLVEPALGCLHKLVSG